MSAVPRASQILLVGQKIRQIRKSRHLTQADLASRIGVTQSDLSRMENGEYKVGLDTLFRILQVFELSMSNFFEEPAAESAGAVPADAEHVNGKDVKPSTDVLVRRVGFPLGRVAPRSARVHRLQEDAGRQIADDRRQ